MQNQRKRPRQNVSTGPHTGQVGLLPGPSGAAGYSGLMPVGGFGRNNQQRTNIPSSGRGAATFNGSASNNNVRSNPHAPAGQNYNNSVQKGNTQHQRAAPRGNAPSVSVQYQQGLRNDTTQNRSIPTGRGRGVPQSFSSMTQNNQASTTYTSYQNGSNTGYNNSSMYGGGIGINQHNWGYVQQPYNDANMMGNITRISSYGQHSFNRGNNSYNQGNEARNVYQQINPIQQQKYMSWPNQEMQPYSVYQQDHGGFLQNQAAEISDEWNNSFTESTPASTQTVNKANKNLAKTSTDQKTAIMELKKSLHFLTVDVTAMKRWNKFKDSVQIIFELFGMKGQLDSATTKGRKAECKEFLIRDEEKNNVTCVFYEIDRQLPKLTRGQWYRLVGNYDETKEIFRCLSIRTLQPSERKMVYLLTQKSAQIMCKLTSNMRES